MRSRLPGVVVLVSGMVLIVASLTTGLFSAGPAIESLTDDFRSSFTSEAISTARRDLAQLEAAHAELQVKGAAVLAAPLGTTSEQFLPFLQERYREVAAGIAALPGITKNFGGLVDLMDRSRMDFARADAVPSKSLPATTAPWVFFSSGVLFATLGALLARRPSAGLVVGTIAASALVLLSALALSLPEKADATDRLVADTKVVFTADQADSARRALETIGGMGTQLQTEVVPAVASRLGVNPGQAVERLGTDLPAVVTALNGLDESRSRFEAMVDRLSRNLGTYRRAARPDLSTLVRLQVATSVVSLAVGLVALTLALRGQSVLGARATTAPPSPAVTA